MAAELFAFEPGRNVRGLFSETGSKLLPVVGIAQERFFATDALDFVAGLQRAIIFSESELPQLWRPGTNQRTEISGVILEVPDRANARSHQHLLRYFANAMNRADGERTKKPDLVPFRDKGETVRLLEIAGELGQQLVGGNANAGSKAALTSNTRPHFASDGH